MAPPAGSEELLEAKGGLGSGVLYFGNATSGGVHSRVLAVAMRGAGLNLAVPGALYAGGAGVAAAAC